MSRSRLVLILWRIVYHFGPTLVIGFAFSAGVKVLFQEQPSTLALLGQSFLFALGLTTLLGQHTALGRLIYTKAWPAQGSLGPVVDEMRVQLPMRYRFNLIYRTAQDDLDEDDVRAVLIVEGARNDRDAEQVREVYRGVGEGTLALGVVDPASHPPTLLQRVRAKLDRRSS